MNEHPDITRDEDAMLAEAFLRRADAALSRLGIWTGGCRPTVRHDGRRPL